MRVVLPCTDRSMERVSAQKEDAYATAVGLESSVATSTAGQMGRESNGSYTTDSKELRRQSSSSAMKTQAACTASQQERGNSSSTQTIADCCEWGNYMSAGGSCSAKRPLGCMISDLYGCIWHGKRSVSEPGVTSERGAAQQQTPTRHDREELNRCALLLSLHMCVRALLSSLVCCACVPWQHCQKSKQERWLSAQTNERNNEPNFQFLNFKHSTRSTYARREREYNGICFWWCCVHICSLLGEISLPGLAKTKSASDTQVLAHPSCVGLG